MITLKHPTVTFSFGVIIGTAIFLLGSRSDNAVSVRRNIIKYMQEAVNNKRYTPAPPTPGYNMPDRLEQSPQELGYKLLQQPDSQLSADELSKTVRVLCFIITTPKYHWTRAIHVKKTWGRRCTKLIFMSTKADYMLGAVKLNVNEGYSYLWAKTKKSLEHIYDKYVDDYDWFLKADDDTYVIMENLRNLLKDYDTDEGHYFGCNFQLSTLSYMSGGAGYVLSRQAVVKFVEEALPDPKKCKSSSVGVEDVEMGKCLKNVGILPDDSRDEFGKHRFLALPPQQYLIPGSLPRDFWWWHYIRFPQKVGKDCCSNTGISFHYITPNDMYLFEFFLYQLRVIGGNKTETLPHPLPPKPKEILEIEDNSSTTPENPGSDFDDLEQSTLATSSEPVTTDPSSTTTIEFESEEGATSVNTVPRLYEDPLSLTTTTSTEGPKKFLRTKQKKRGKSKTKPKLIT